MPNTSSARKQVRVTQKRRLRNKPIHSLTKTGVRKAEELIFSGQLEPAAAEVVGVISSLDRAVGKGIIHPNNAARRKSRLMKKLNQAKAEPSA